ncbi:hypothetical protein N431DRAFT_456437 [Stipitochalara longipes BDJ]|nr:hypothetical protein N431DRAFT_456437 [Stipitochalara longipes BDJ]
MANHLPSACPPTSDISFISTSDSMLPSVPLDNELRSSSQIPLSTNTRFVSDLQGPSSSNMISASLAIPEQLPGSTISDEVSYEIHKLVNNSPSNQLMQATESTFFAQPPSPTVTCGSLGKFPREIRDKIYGYLLLNPILGQSEIGWDIPDPDGWNRLPVKYGLCTSIIYACKTISKEALDVLYECNTFYLSCFARHETAWLGPPHSESPLLRYSNTDWDTRTSDDKCPPAIEVVFRRVRRWKVLVTAFEQDFHLSRREFPSRVLTKLCKVINNSRPLSVEILLVPQNIEGMIDHRGGTFHDVKEVLRPLNLRNIPAGVFRLRDATLDEIHPEHVDGSLRNVIPKPPIISQLPPSLWRRELMLLTESTNQLNMSARCTQAFCAMLNLLSAAGEPLNEGLLTLRFGNCVRSINTNPFKESKNPIEGALSDAKLASYVENLTPFKQYRAAVLTYLEPQYHRIMAAYIKFVDLLSIKTPFYNLLSDSCARSDFVEQGLAAETSILMEQFAATFIRDVPFKV